MVIMVNHAAIDRELATLWKNRNKKWEEVLKKSHQLRQTAHDVGYLNGELAAFVLQANSLLWLNKTEETFSTLERAEALLNQDFITKWTLRLHFIYGELYRNLGDYDLSLDHYMITLQYAEKLGDVDEISHANGNIGIIYVHLQEYKKGIEEFQKVLDKESKQPEDNYNLFTSYLNLAYAYYQLKKPAQAISMASKSLDYAETERNLIMAHGNLGAAYLLADELEKAKEHLKKSYDLSRKAGDKISQCVCCLDLSDYFFQVGENNKVKDLLTEALKLAQSIDYKQGIKDANEKFYTLYQTEENWQQALEHHKAMYKVDREMFNDNSDRRLQNLEVLHKVGELRKANERQKQEHQRLSNMKDLLLRDVSHDLRNPIGVIFSATHLMRKQIAIGATGEQLNELCDTIERQSKRISQLVADVLEMARLEVSSDANFHPINMTELIENLWSDLEDHAKTKNIELLLEQSSPIRMLGNRTSLEVMINNLVENAIKYTEQEGKVRVLIESMGKDKFKLEVDDTGIGIPKDALPKIFDQYYRAPAHQNLAEGTGLGLAIVKRVVDLHHGTIDVTSEIKKGTKFTIALQTQPKA